MATSSQYQPSRSEAGEEIHPLNSGMSVPSKSFIVGRYDEYGHRTSPGEFLGTESAANKYKRQLLDSMRNHGRVMPGYVLTDQGPLKQTALVKPIVSKPDKKTPKASQSLKKQAHAEPVYETVTRPEPVVIQEDKYADAEPSKAKRAGFNIAFSIESGKIKSTVDAVLETNEALMLVFKDDDAVSYEPEKGSQLIIITPDKRKISVMYLGVKFAWHDTRQQLLVFMKTDVEEE